MDSFLWMSWGITGLALVFMVLKAYFSKAKAYKEAREWHEME